MLDQFVFPERESEREERERELCGKHLFNQTVHILLYLYINNMVNVHNMLLSMCYMC